MISKKKQFSLALGIVFAACAIAASGGDGPARKGDQYVEPAGATWGDYQVLATADAEEAFPDDHNSGDLCVPFGAQVEIQFNGGSGPCVWAMTDDLTFDGASNAEDACNVTDANGPDGKGACFYAIDKDRINQVPSYGALRGAIGARQGICTIGKTAYPGGPYVYPPCRIDADCTTAFGITGATCDTSLSDNDMKKMTEDGCAVLICGADTNSTGVHIRIEK